MKVFEALANLELEVIASRRVKDPEQAKDLKKSLMADLTPYPEQKVIDAIFQHRLTNKWWPALSDLMKFINPPETEFQKELRLSREYREKARKEADKFINYTDQKAIPDSRTPEQVAEHRKSVVDEVMSGLKLNSEELK